MDVVAPVEIFFFPSSPALAGCSVLDGLEWVVVVGVWISVPM